MNEEEVKKKKTPFLLPSLPRREYSRRQLMAAEVSSFGRLARAYKEDGGGGGDGKRGELVTRDLLGGGAVLGSPEVDLELQVPAGWERRLDLLSGKTYLQKHESDQHLHDLNLPPPPPAAASVKTTALFPEFSSALDLRLVSAAATAPSSSSAASEYQSVCTLEKVKSALERAERESRLGAAAPGAPHPPSPSSSTTSSSVKRRSPPVPAAVIDVDVDGPATTDASESSQAPPVMMVVAGCPACLLYVFVTKAEPTCPKCGAHVPVHEARRPRQEKKPRIDLNFSAANDGDE